VLETINNVSTRDMPLAFADFLLHGDAGTSIEMGVIRVRKGTDAQKISLVRADIPTPSVESKMLADGVGYVQIHSLEPGQAKAAATKLSDLEKQGAKRFVVDLRDCVLGQPEEGYAFANMFLDKGLMGYLMGQKVARKDFQADPTKAVFRQPTVLITNRGAANGAEVAASALLENKRAEVVGERTYGDAAQRKAITLDDGGAVILAVAKYYSPGGKAIQDVAVTPSLPVAEAGAPTGDSDDDGAAAPNTPEKKSGEDLQLKKAIEVVTVGLAAAKKSGVEPAAAAKGPATAPAPALGPLNVPRPKQ
jgi:carboxyl-terminal processing protease